MNRIVLLSLAFVFILSSCKNETESNEWKLPEPYKLAKQSMEANGDVKSAKTFIQEVRKAIPAVENREQKMILMKDGLAASEEYKLGPTAIGFLMPLVKEYKSSPVGEEYLAKLASALSDIGKTIPADVLIKAYNEQYPNGKYSEVINKKVKQKIENVDTFLVNLASNIFENPDKYGVNRISAQKYVDACEAYAIGYPEREMAPEYLYRAGEMARTIKTFPKALSIYDWINEDYPEYEKAPTTMFLKGFMLENEIRDKDAAKKVYQEFLTKYPKNDLVDDVNFLLSNIDKSDEEIMKIIEQNKEGK